MKTTGETFAMMCFIVLMNHHGNGYIEAHPIYLEEKQHMIGSGYNAFAMLDIHNKRTVIKWLEKWNIEVPEIIQKEMKLQEEAAENLGL